MALRREWERARGIQPPLTKEQKENLERGRRHIFEAQVRAYNHQKETQRLRAERAGMAVVSKQIPDRIEADSAHEQRFPAAARTEFPKGVANG